MAIQQSLPQSTTEMPTSDSNRLNLPFSEFLRNFFSDALQLLEYHERGIRVLGIGRTCSEVDVFGFRIGAHLLLRELIGS